LRLTIIIGSFAVLILLYTLYLLWQGSFGSASLAFVVMLISIATACRYHFWYFQVKNRKLGCTIKEWLNEKVSGDQ
ncbi:MAG: type IV secretion protein IcmV, partial [Gammaproteobacteria bacterium]